MIASIIFVCLSVGAFSFFIYKMLLIRSNIRLGRDVNRTDRRSDRLKNMLLVAFGQKKMFSRPLPALLHLAIYVAFIITQIELIEIVVDGIGGSHRIFRPYLGAFYPFMISLIEVLSVAAFIATIIFFSRRNLIRVPRLNLKELNGWPRMDANMILFMEFILVTCIFMMNSADEVLLSRGESHAAALFAGETSFNFTVSSLLGPGLLGGLDTATLHLLERVGWWGHITMVFAFLNYLPFSKHLHILLAFPNTYFANLEAKGKFTNSEAVSKEVKLMMDPSADPYAASGDNGEVPQRFGAKDVNDLTWKNLLDAYSCTECGRCTSSCPANITGKLLSPRKIIMATRDRLEEYGAGVRKSGADFQDGKSLFGTYITDEEIWACTSCNACVQECPVNIDPLSIILELRRYSVMEESKMPSELTGMLTNIENNGAPWQFSQADRLNWVNEA